jgi:hypothetical protein
MKLFVYDNNWYGYFIEAEDQAEALQIVAEVLRKITGKVPELLGELFEVHPTGKAGILHEWAD